MLRNYFKIALRNLARNKGYSFINISGLAVGMAVAMLIGLWVYDELTYDHYHKNHDRIAQVWQSRTSNGEINTLITVPRPLEMSLRNEYADYFQHIVMSSWTLRGVVAYGNKRLVKEGNYMQPAAPEMLSLEILAGLKEGLQEINSIMLAASTAKGLFGDEDPIGKIVRFDNKHELKVTSVFADIPASDSFHETTFIIPWEHLVANTDWIRNAVDQWGNNSFRLFVQLADNATMSEVSAKIKDIKLKANPEIAEQNPQFLLLPMNDWHLRSTFENGVQAGGGIENVWLFGIIGAFVLLLACINFMNLNTARSEKRAREVGIRKSVGSVRSQLVSQFLSESFLVVGLAFMVAMLLVLLLIPAFNTLADKQITFPWENLYFWGISLFFIVVTAMLSGSYPALYLSSFQPVKVLKGTFRVGRYAALPRKVLVVLQFTVSVALIIGTLTVFRQIQFTKNRPIGYDRAGLVQIPLTEGAFDGKYAFIRNELINSGAVIEMSATSNPTTEVYYGRGGFKWAGMPEDFQASFAWIWVSPDYVKSLGMKIITGRDFSPDFPSDSSAVLLNKTAVEYMGLKDPVGTVLRDSDEQDPGKGMKVIGVVDDMVMDSPYESVKPTVYDFNPGPVRFYHLRLAPNQSANKSIATVEGVFKKNFPDLPFEYKFVDDEYAAKFSSEERIGKLAGVFTGLAILISCLGLFGLASYVAEQRTKEIGVRKVLGASVASLWRLMSRDFVLLVLIALLIAVPLAVYFLDGWLQNYTYRTELSWWIFAAAGAGALVLTLLTVSFQAIKAALVDPVKSLRSE
ncbi:FtsX-like permease family protein [Cytophagaceae bacterium SJW1-29]|uniref:FtsX-like permease family protein n=2 Tax=Salmonirosea aquatica TaxID=2654236 RepID=A0A7C9BMD1_9BACT|nr:FtsX-like permease family protein [Cytophagaceae bacterium SJW1-29]